MIVMIVKKYIIKNTSPLMHPTYKIHGVDSELYEVTVV